MRIVKISDGLGNQMFQYAFALAWHKFCGEAVYLDRFWFPEFGYSKLRKAITRRYGLGAYQISLPLCSREESLAAEYGVGFLGKANRFFHHHVGRVQESGAVPLRLDALPEKAIVRGFFQNVAYPAAVRAELLQEFSLAPESLNEANLEILRQIEACNCPVAVHVRRGDYLQADNCSYYGLCGADYYAAAEKILEERLGQDLHLFLFSDDPDWLRTHYRSQHPCSLVTVNGSEDGQFDIWLMRHCRGHIIANSTFSWWGAWLCEAQGKEVVAPKHWCVDAGVSARLCPPEWHCL